MRGCTVNTGSSYQQLLTCDIRTHIRRAVVELADLPTICVRDEQEPLRAIERYA